MGGVSTGDVQRLFLQAMLSRGILSEKLAKAIWVQCIKAVKNEDGETEIPYTNTEQSWELFLGNVNSTIDDLDLEFKGIQDELTGKRLFSLVNRKDDESAQMATDFSPSEIIYFKAIIEQIMLACNESFSLSSIAALGEATALKGKINMTKAQAEHVLASFVAKGWLLKSKRGRYSLSPRTLLELYPYLKGTYPDEILECTICHEVLTKGIACHTPNCTVRMHYHCFKTFARRNGACPQCKADWPREVDGKLIPVGEDAVQDEKDVGKRHVRARTSTGSDDSGEEMEPSQTQKIRKGKSSKMEVDGDESEEAIETDGEGDGYDDRPQETQNKRRGGRG